ncbi:diguanylate cyclase [Chitinimonas sp.]|uniref:sensor domain-containing diguanylate cyclase n=1 Tax=Chitinimonas sp. TaxID=1934313 RepID=UPI0035B0B654
MSRLTLGRLLTLSIVLVSLLMGVVMTLALGQLASETLRQEVANAQHELADHMRARLDIGLYQRLREIEVLATLGQLRDPASDARDNRYVLEKLWRSYAEIVWLGLADRAGLVEVATDGRLEGSSMAASDWFKEAHNGAHIGAMPATAPLAAGRGEGPWIAIASPVYAIDGHLRGVLAAQLSWQWVTAIEQAVFSDERRQQGMAVFILARDGRVLLANKPVPSLPAAAILATLVEQGRPQRLVWPDGRDYLTSALPTRGYGDFAGPGWMVLVRQPAAIAYLPVRQLQWLIAAIGAGMMLLVALFGRWLAGRLAAPLVGLSHAADRIRLGQVDAAMPMDGYHEAATLARSLRHLVDTLAAEQAKLRRLNEGLEAEVAQRTEMLNVTNRHLLSALGERHQLVARLELLANTDSMTGLLNRRAFFERAAIELRRVERLAAPLSILILDIDHFKRINDSHGHQAGDEAIRQLAECMKAELREVDVLSRFGGEEFVALLPDTDLAQAARVAERLRRAISVLRVVSPAGPIPLSASLGVAGWQAGLSIETVLSQADTALYDAKHGGRNQVRVWPAPA